MQYVGIQLRPRVKAIRYKRPNQAAEWIVCCSKYQKDLPYRGYTLREPGDRAAAAVVSPEAAPTAGVPGVPPGLTTSQEGSWTWLMSRPTKQT